MTSERNNTDICLRSLESAKLIAPVLHANAAPLFGINLRLSELSLFNRTVFNCQSKIIGTCIWFFFTRRGD